MLSNKLANGTFEELRRSKCIALALIRHKKECKKWCKSVGSLGIRSGGKKFRELVLSFNSLESLLYETSRSGSLRGDVSCSV